MSLHYIVGVQEKKCRGAGRNYLIKIVLDFQRIGWSKPIWWQNFSGPRLIKGGSSFSTSQFTTYPPTCCSLYLRKYFIRIYLCYVSEGVYSKYTILLCILNLYQTESCFHWIWNVISLYTIEVTSLMHFNQNI